ncbi:hypothetical protein HCA58_12060 [Micromonospora sp. HNM0581]|uniref:hypothetical protein n=1 Tax=Micromonospora sp. HNM0581 TaxID=2716341 RepID=UPI00146EBF24|nr:hypothetical protein [Micromonospora sp. HNM0581]NLU79097.1 hypothetical protein [Micromonospora sp. HNM0581]
MRVSEYYKLDKKQSELDFVDVDIVNDVRLYVDPRAIAQLSGPWADSCASSIQSFFQRVLDAITDGDNDLALSLLSNLREPNETHLGLSRGPSKGSGVGNELARDFWQALSSSKAVRTGLIQDLEDTALLIEGVDRDRISDITTNIIRRQLISYTQETSEYHGIPLDEGVASGPLWNSNKGEWHEEYTSLPKPNGAKLILIPKEIVRRKLHMNSSDYYRHQVLNFLVAQEYAAGSLVKLVRGRPTVTKKDVDAKYKEQFGVGRDNPGVEKRINSAVSADNPDILPSYKEQKAANPSRILEDHEIAEAVGGDVSEAENLLARVIEVEPGSKQADLYERRIQDLFTAIFYPHLVHPKRQHPLHDGRKRLDLTYTNAARHGFFQWLSMHYPSANIMIECKNYNRPIDNPALDQLQGRFSPSRGTVGLLVYRGYTDKEKTWKSCLDTAHDRRGYIIPLDDDDLKFLVQELSAPTSGEAFGYLHQLFNRLTHN